MHKKVIIYSDGGARGNPGPSAIGILICDAKGRPVKECREVIGHGTNNVAEYRAVLKGLDLAAELGAEEVDYYVDSQLVQRQLTGQYRIKTPHIQELVVEVKKLEKKFKRVTYFQVPREHEKLKYVDKLVNIALDQSGH